MIMVLAVVIIGSFAPIMEAKSCKHDRDCVGHCKKVSYLNLIVKVICD